MKPESTAVGKRNGSTNDHSAVLERISHLSLEPNPVLMEHAKHRAESVQNRIADRITESRKRTARTRSCSTFRTRSSSRRRRSIPTLKPDRKARRYRSRELSV